jgi:hypothetical protein
MRMFRIVPLSRWSRGARRAVLAGPLGFVTEALQDAASRRLGPAYARPSLPPAISIETGTACNQRCAFCPQSRTPRPAAAMSDATFARIVARLREADYRGAVVLSLNNEPLLDARLEQRVKALRESGFKGHLEILTNGLLLTRERAVALFAAGLDRIIVNSYSETGAELTGALREWVPGKWGQIPFCPSKMVSVPTFPGKELLVHYRLRDEVLTNRAGSAPNKPRAALRRASCLWPFTMLAVTTDGSAFLCCNDFHTVTKFGSVEGHSLSALWTHPYLEDVRRRLAAADRAALPLCAPCDFKGYLNPCPVWFARVLGI